MDKEILKQMYKPICIHEYSDGYFESLKDVIEAACNENSFEWFIECIKSLTLKELNDELRISLVNYLHSVDVDISQELISRNNAELLVFTQAILYECIINNEDKARATGLSLALNTILYGIEESLNQFYLAKMKTFYREISIKTIQEARESQNNDFINAENKVLKWMLSIDRKKYSDLNDEQFAYKLGKELAEKSGVNPIFNYPEAYVTKILLASIDGKDSHFEEKDIEEIMGKLYSNIEKESCDNVLCPILNRTIKNNIKISLIDFSIEVYYEQMLLNHLKVLIHAD